MMNYQEAEAFLFDQLPMFQRVGAAAYKKDLQNTIDLLSAIGNPHQKGKYIHVAGTNGKGSTSSMLASILTEAGYKVGLYTSPHLKQFTERMRINGTSIGEERVVGYVQQFKPLIQSIRPSFFELTTAMAFHYFNEEKTDINLIEVGMGGRLDCTNVIDPELCVITQIGLDHQQFLGNTLEEICREKAGIIKEKVPVVSSISENELRLILESTAKEKNAPYYDANSYYAIQPLPKAENTPQFLINNLRDSFEFIISPFLFATYQIPNIKSVLTAVEVLRSKHYQLSESHVQKGLKHIIANTGLKGRWQILQEKPFKMVADTGHNRQAFEQINVMLQQEDFRKLHMVFGTVNDKAIESVLEILPKEASYYFTQASIPRALEVEALRKMANQYGLKGRIFTTVPEAIDAAKKNAQKDDLIFIGGSTFVVAEIPDL